MSGEACASVPLQRQDFSIVQRLVLTGDCPVNVLPHPVSKFHSFEVPVRLPPLRQDL